MTGHTNQGLEIQTIAGTFIRVHGTAAEVEALTAHIDNTEDVMIRRDPEPCNEDLGCFFVEAWVNGDTTAATVGNGWIASIAALN